MQWTCLNAYFTCVFPFRGTAKLEFIYNDLIIFFAGKNPLWDKLDGLKMEYLHEPLHFAQAFISYLGRSRPENKYLCFTETYILNYFTMLLGQENSKHILSNTLSSTLKPMWIAREKAICMFLINLHLTHQNVVF